MSRWSRISKSNSAPLADLAERDGVLVRLALGRVRVRKIGQRRRELVPRFLHPRQLGLLLLQPPAELAHLGDRLVGVLALALELGDLIGDAVAARPSLLDLRQDLPAALVQAQ